MDSTQEKELKGSYRASSSSETLSDYQCSADNSSITKRSVETCQKSELNILSNLFVTLNEKFIAHITRQTTKPFNKKVKILNFSSDLVYKDILSFITGLCFKEYSELFILIFELKNDHLRRSRGPNDGSVTSRSTQIIKKIKKKLVGKFSQSRPLILQFVLVDQNETKYFYKDEISPDFLQVNQQDLNCDDITDFSTFLSSFLSQKCEDFENLMINIITKVSNSSLILKFLRILNLSDEFYGSIVLEVAQTGTKQDLLSALDASFDGNGKTLSIEAQSYISSVFYDDEDQDDSQNLQKSQTSDTLAVNSPELTEQLERRSSAKFQNNVLIVSPSVQLSVLYTAVNNKNQEIANYLITNWTQLIQQLPLDHQILISTAAFKTDQFDVLCDLLQLSDYPFPADFNTLSDVSANKNKRLCQILSERIEFSTAIKDGNLAKTEKIINKNLKLKIFYNPVNKSALDQALEQALISKNYNIYYYLMSLGFKGTKSKNLKEILSGDELKRAKLFAVRQRHHNVNKSLCDNQQSINTLCNKSTIHNIGNITHQQEVEYRKKIRSWYEGIYKIPSGPEFLEVVASCDKLKIIFAFESESVENASLSDPNSLGQMYPKSKWIFVGAKLSDKKREQEIKGVLAHELCHYVLRLIFENQEKPYYKQNKVAEQVFEEIIKEINKWSSNISKDLNDQCNGIISSVFKCYEKKDFHVELIVRIVQMLVVFDDNAEKLKSLRDIKDYKMLFTFWEFYVVPEFKKFNLKSRQNVRKLNNTCEIFVELENSKINFSRQKDIGSLLKNQLTIVTTNFPKLLLRNIYSNLKKEFEDLNDAKNIFIDAIKFKNQEILNDLIFLLDENPKLTVVVDCSHDIPDNIHKIGLPKESILILIVENDKQLEELENCLKFAEMCPVKSCINFYWSDLNHESQKLLISTKINFQNTSEFSFLEILNSESTISNIEEIFNDFSEIIDDKLLNLLTENSKISVNTKCELKNDDLQFKLLFQPRKFIKNKNQIKSEISQSELLDEVKNKHYVLISDIAGNGKSWVMKNFANILKERNPTKWLTFVDLKQFIDDFQAHKNELAFSHFFVDKILKLQNNFEYSIFQKLYENGKVLILFDGFDEIAPNCSEFVLQLAKIFKFNGGNQLWIATRDYFENNLQQSLGISVIYNLDKFTETDGLNMIVASWMLMDIQDQQKTITKDEFEKYLKKSKNLKIYQQKARKIVHKVAMSKNRSVGLPQLFKMIADGFKDDKDAALDPRGLRIYSKFALNLLRRWSREKGSIREKASLQCEERQMSFWKFHQFKAFQSLFPELVIILFPNYKGTDWPEEEIIACGVMTKKGGQFYFLHETFLEFFIADLIAKELANLKPIRNSKIKSFTNLLKVMKKKTLSDCIVDLVCKILINREYSIIRTFLNDAIDDSSKLQRIVPIMQKQAKSFYSCKIFCDFFTQNLENFANFAILILKMEDYETVKRILDENIWYIILNKEELNMFHIFLEFFFDFLKVDDLKEIIKTRHFFQYYVELNFETNLFEDFANRTAQKISLELTKTILKEELIFYRISEVKIIESSKVGQIIKIMSKYFDVIEMSKLMRSCDDDNNILQVFFELKNIKNIKIFWIEVEKYFKIHNSHQIFKDMVKEEFLNGETILHYSAQWFKSLEFYKVFWTLLLTTFDDREEFTNFLLTINQNGDNFIHLFIKKCQTFEIIELVFENLKINLKSEQFLRILKSKDLMERNVHQSAAFCINNLKIHMLLWKIISKSYERSENFLIILQDLDKSGDNLIDIAAKNLDCEIFEFMIFEIEKIANNNNNNLLPNNQRLSNNQQVCKIFKNLKSTSKILLHKAAKNSKSINFHQKLWLLIKKYLEPSEISNLIKEIDSDKNNIFMIIIRYNTKEIVELTWREIQKFLLYEELVKYLKMKNNYDNNLIQISLLNQGDSKNMSEFIQNIVTEFDLRFENFY